ncbi:hypothetical protein ARAM_006899 [Aspergillus rambellii]|uniref:DUF4139 domain-containing protein n=1 Tax=Aspergillus rambellii TaxID=308745 RepID=A0A0F8XLY1_9EURO|nr:hypothetical protein ARAM_006899 [Aspergillus rambellii]
MAEIASSEVLISELPTKQIILAPKQATVVREIFTSIQPGQNEITIIGLDPKVNPESIRIEGSGSAVITDIQTNIIPRQEHFEDVYPSETEEETATSEEDEDFSEDEDGLNDPEMQEIRKEIAEVEAKLAKARNIINASISVLKMMDEYGKNLHGEKQKNVSKLDDFLSVYTVRRADEAERHHKANAELDSGQKEIAKLQRKLFRRQVRYAQEQKKASRAIRRRNEKRARIRQQRKLKVERVRREQRSFWTSDVGQIIVSLDSQMLGAFATPMSSRRSSIIEKPAGERSTEKQEPIDVVLRLSYIVPGPHWVSRYELRINSPSSSAQMTYRAEFTNSCSETWKDTRLTLSTSKASFSGIGVRIPSLEAWNIKLVTAHSKASPSWDKILNSQRQYPASNVFDPVKNKGGLFTRAQQQMQCQLQAQARLAAPAATSGLFGGLAPSALGFAANVSQPSTFGAPDQQSLAQSAFGSAAVPQQTGGLFGSSTQPRGFGQAPQPPPPPPPARALAAPGIPAAAAAAAAAATESANVESDLPSSDNSDPILTAGVAAELEELDDSDKDNLADTNSLVLAVLEHQDSVKQDYGMTTTYEIPGQRTLVPSHVCRRHVLAELDLKSVALTYVIVPKLREAAFLRARIKNTSSLTLHPGRVGITVDGSFVGTASLDTCGPNVYFNISLGIDPGIEVKYAKPTVRPLTGTMFFNKEDGAKFRRSCWVKNNKSTAVDLIVSDQIPVTDDEKLRLSIREPQGLEKEGDQANLQMEKRKGHGTAKLSKNGDVTWMLRLQPGQDMRLVLEYEAKVPTGNDVAAI